MSHIDKEVVFLTAPSVRDRQGKFKVRRRSQEVLKALEKFFWKSRMDSTRAT
jgi:hypothetical protein